VHCATKCFTNNTNNISVWCYMYMYVSIFRKQAEMMLIQCPP